MELRVANFGYALNGFFKADAANFGYSKLVMLLVIGDRINGLVKLLSHIGPTITFTVESQGVGLVVKAWGLRSLFTPNSQV